LLAEKTKKYVYKKSAPEPKDAFGNYFTSYFNFIVITALFMAGTTDSANSMIPLTSSPGHPKNDFKQIPTP
jgi:hypothetical protein